MSVYHRQVSCYLLTLATFVPPKVNLDSSSYTAQQGQIQVPWYSSLETIKQEERDPQCEIWQPFIAPSLQQLCPWEGRAMLPVGAASRAAGGLLRKERFLSSASLSGQQPWSLTPTMLENRAEPQKTLTKMFKVHLIHFGTLLVSSPLLPFCYPTLINKKVLFESFVIRKMNRKTISSFTILERN